MIRIDCVLSPSLRPNLINISLNASLSLKMVPVIYHTIPDRSIVQEGRGLRCDLYWKHSASRQRLKGVACIGSTVQAGRGLRCGLYCYKVSKGQLFRGLSYQSDLITVLLLPFTKFADMD